MKYYVYISDTKVNMLYDQIGLEEPKSEAGSSLRNNLNNFFTDSELRDLCFDLNVDYDVLQGISRNDKARELIIYLRNRNRIDELLESVRTLRPKVEWPTDYSETEKTNGGTAKYAKLNAVVDYIEKHEEVGSVDEPKSYFRGDMSLKWGYDVLSPPKSVIFVGTTEKTLLVLGGSPKHVIGVDSSIANLNYMFLPSHLSGIVWALGKVDEETEYSKKGRVSFKKDTLERTAARALVSDGLENRLKFLARRLTTEDIELTQQILEKYHTDYAWNYGRTIPIQAIFGSPLYVALSE